MRRLLSIFLLTIFFFQVIPLKAIGKLLNPGQSSEETQTDGGDNPDGKIIKSWDDHLMPDNTMNLSESRSFFNNKVRAFFYIARPFEPAPVAKIPSPPPDFI